MSDQFRIAVIGLGNWARRAYLPNIDLMDDVVLAAMSTRSKENAEAAMSLVSSRPRVYRDWQTLLSEGGFEAVVVATAPPSHREIAEAAMRAGYAVLCEKPLALSVEDSDALAEAAGRRGVPLQVGLEFRHAPVLVETAERIARGQIGTPTLVACEILRNKRESVLSDPERWTRYGGVFLEFLCHYFDVLSWFAHGEPVAVSGTGGKRLGTDAWDHGAISVEHDNGAVATLAFSLFAPPTGERLRISVLGDSGSLEVSLKAGEIKYFPAEGDKQPEVFVVPEPVHPSKPYPGSFEQIRAFVEAVSKGGRPKADAVVWTRLMSVATAANRAMEERQRVTLTE